MEEMAEQEKEQARIEAMEAALDVKQSGMGGFYRSETASRHHHNDVKPLPYFIIMIE